MIRLEIKILMLTNKGEMRIRIRNIIGELNDIEKPPKGLNLSGQRYVKDIGRDYIDLITLLHHVVQFDLHLPPYLLYH